jgi:protein SCO1/2
MGFNKATVIFFSVCGLFFLIGCQQSKELPMLGLKDNPEESPIPEFKFVNQDSIIVTKQTVDGRIYIADFFFTSCPTICPKLAKSMKRLHDEFLEDDDIFLLSHSIDTRRDTVGRLKWYANKLNVDHDKWYFVTGKKDDIFSIAENYMSIAIDDPEAPGGFDHSGYLILLDKKGRIRSFCNGTDPDDVTRFIKKIKRLQKSYD